MEGGDRVGWGGFEQTLALVAALETQCIKHPAVPLTNLPLPQLGDHSEKLSSHGRMHYGGCGVTQRSVR